MAITVDMSSPKSRTVSHPLRIHMAPVANLLSLNEDLKTADMAQARFRAAGW